MKLFFFLSIVLLSSCSGEDREQRIYGPNAYKIAGDTVPWANEPYNGNQMAWDHQMEKRARHQNEYQRIR
jgi:hypothetical protein